MYYIVGGRTCNPFSQMKLTTTVYKYKRFAHWGLLLLVAAIILFFYFSVAMNPALSMIGIALLFFIAIYSALRPKSIFSLRAVDERKLVITPDELVWGTWRMPIQEIKKLEVYIYAFDNFKHVKNKSGGRKFFYNTEYGDRNTITFYYQGIRYDLIFYLGTFEHYDVLFKITQRWREKGIVFSAKSAFTDSYIREQVKYSG